MVQRHGHRIYSALLAGALLASSILVINKLTHLQGKLAGEGNVHVIIGDPPFDLPMPDAVSQADHDLANPPVWETGRARGSIFVPEPYTLDRNNEPVKVDEYASHLDSFTHEPIPNRWFTEHHLSPLAANAPLLDPDKDGFTNEDERRYGTDPNDPNSHPPYYTKLFLKQFIKVPCRLVFKGFNGDINKPKSWEFQVETIDIHQPSSFLKIGELVEGTKFRLERFERKEAENVTIHAMSDVSELTLINTETGEPVVLVRDKVTDAPDRYALFDYQWPPAAGEIRVRKLQDFGLRPESTPDRLYRLMDVNDSEAQIRLPDGEMKTIGRDPRNLLK